MGPGKSAEYVYSDKGQEFIAATKQLNWEHDLSTPYRKQSNGVAERAIQRVKEGTRCTLIQSGLYADFWAEAQEC